MSNSSYQDNDEKELYELGKIALTTSPGHLDKMIFYAFDDFLCTTVTNETPLDSNNTEYQKLSQTLSQREKVVLLMLMKGRNVSEISDIMNLSNKTVSYCMSRLLNKLNLQHDTELANYITRQNIA